jgi:hypothetical protein
VRSYRLALAALAGTGFSALITLLLNLRSPDVLLLSILMLPGGLIASFWPHSDEIYPPLVFLAANSVVYSAAAFVVVVYGFSKVNVRGIKRSVIAIVFPIAVLTSMACVPSLNPFWPRKMEHLAEEETDLRQGLPVGAGVAECREFLRSRGIQSYEVKLKSQQEISRRGGPPMIAQAGDR